MRFEEYADKYANIKLSRSDDGVLEVAFHTDGGPLLWTTIGGAHSEFADCFANIARDPENRVVLMTGTGDAYSLPHPTDPPFAADTATWDIIMRNAQQMLNGLLNIDALVVSCINGPAVRHPEIPLLADIVLAADHATVQDEGHFINRLAPLDGMNIIMPLLMGYNRGRYFLLTGQTLNAQEMHDLGLVSEVMPREQLLARGRELAHELAQQNPLVIRYTRRLFTHPLKRAMHDLLGYGLALEGLGYIDERGNA